VSIKFRRNSAQSQGEGDGPGRLRGKSKSRGTRSAIESKVARGENFLPSLKERGMRQSQGRGKKKKVYCSVLLERIGLYS